MSHDVCRKQALEVEIDTVKPYAEDYYACIEEAKKELQNHERPERKALPENLDPYDTIYVGFPN